MDPLRRGRRRYDMVNCVGQARKLGTALTFNLNCPRCVVLEYKHREMQTPCSLFFFLLPPELPCPSLVLGLREIWPVKDDVCRIRLCVCGGMLMSINSRHKKEIFLPSFAVSYHRVLVCKSVKHPSSLETKRLPPTPSWNVKQILERKTNGTDTWLLALTPNYLSACTKRGAWYK